MLRTVQQWLSATARHTYARKVWLIPSAPCCIFMVGACGRCGWGCEEGQCDTNNLLAGITVKQKHAVTYGQVFALNAAAEGEALAVPGNGDKAVSCWAHSDAPSPKRCATVGMQALKQPRSVRQGRVVNAPHVLLH